MTIDLVSLFAGVGIGVIALMGLGFWLAHFKVEEGHLAVLTRFGRLVNKGPSKALALNGSISNGSTSAGPASDNLFSPGAHWKWPWDKVIHFSVMERIIDLSGEKGGKYAMADDGTVMRLDSKIRFKPQINNIYSYLFELKNPMGHIREMFTCIIRNEIANFKNNSNLDTEVLGSYSLIRRERKKLNHQMELICKEQLDSDYGIQFRGVDLIDIVPPHELEFALNGIQSAKTEAETLYAKAEADSRQKIIAAEQGVEIAKLRAESVTLELQILAKTIKKLMADGEVDHYLYHRKMELVGDSKMLFVQRGDLKW